ncbi:hypothetical protein LEP1GSC071_0165 [Leptospira santarosai str. JET]|nr:hypothetical protein LEP1GSC071_0165 [Leptospira santarosai str. JET]
MLSPSKTLTTISPNQLTTCNALAGAATIGNAFLNTYTGGMVSYDLSYSYEDGFGASVGGGMKIMDGLGIGATLSYNEQSGFGASIGLQAGTSALSYNAGLSYSQSGGISANAGIGLGLGRNAATGSYSSTLNLGVSYNRRDGFGTSVGISRNNNVVMPGVGATISRSEYGGLEQISHRTNTDKRKERVEDPGLEA